MDIDFFSCFIFRHNYQRYIAFFIAVNLLIHAKGIMRLPMFEIQYDGTYVLIDAIKIISLRIKIPQSSQCHILRTSPFPLLSPLGDNHISC